MGFFAMVPYAALVAVGGFSLEASPVCHTYPGMMRCGAGQVEKIAFVGQVNLMNTIVQNDTDVKGMLSANQASFNEVLVHGKADLLNTKVKGLFHIDGYLSANNSVFHTILANTNKMKLFSSVVDSIQIQSTSQSSELHLHGQTQVNGNIEFLGYPGKVYRSSGVTLNGRVLGAEVIEVNL